MFAAGKRSEFHGLFRVPKYKERHVSNSSIRSLSKHSHLFRGTFSVSRRSWCQLDGRLVGGKKKNCFTVARKRGDRSLGNSSAWSTYSTTIRKRYLCYYHAVSVYHSVSDSVVDVSVIVIPRKRGEDDTKKEERGKRLKRWRDWPGVERNRVRLHRGWLRSPVAHWLTRNRGSPLVQSLVHSPDSHTPTADSTPLHRRTRALGLSLAYRARHSRLSVPPLGRLRRLASEPLGSSVRRSRRRGTSRLQSAMRRDDARMYIRRRDVYYRYIIPLHVWRLPRATHCAGYAWMRSLPQCQIPWRPPCATPALSTPTSTPTPTPTARFDL